MEGYFKGYETEINFIDEDEFRTVHYKKPHRGRVIATLSTGIYKENRHRVYFDAELDSNPEFTSSILLSSAEAAFRMKKEGYTGAFTLYDIPPKYFVSAGASDCYHLL